VHEACELDELLTAWLHHEVALRRSGAPFELNPTALGRATMLSSGGMTKRLDRMVEAGLLERSPDPADRRGTRVRLKERGKAAIDRAVETHVANEERLVGPLTAAERRGLDRALRKLLNELEAAAGR
jgi:DNA-binding MarR family transcriptional regulator